MKVVFGDLIPGETPIDDISGLLIPEIATRTDLNIAEAENILEVLTKYFARQPTKSIAPFDIEWAKNLHRKMFSNVWNWAGVYRQHELNIGAPFVRIQEISITCSKISNFGDPATWT